MLAYYNDNDPFCCQWLRNLIKAGHIMKGEVDERPIEEVQPEDLKGFTRHHFFAGIAGWERALQLAGWSEEEPVWTGSCPCQPFSGAGRRQGEHDSRHLWPAFFRLISKCGPSTVFGEQVTGSLGREWVSAVRLDLEKEGYAVGIADLPAAGVGAPHIRQRLWWVADSKRGKRRQDGLSGYGQVENTDGYKAEQFTGSRHVSRMADSNSKGYGRGCRGPLNEEKQSGRREKDGSYIAETCGRDGGVGDPLRIRRQQKSDIGRGDGTRSQPSEQGSESSHRRIHGWEAADFIQCSDGKARPTEPGLCPLAHGFPGRVGQLRSYGNAIVPQVASVFIKSFMMVKMEGAF